MYEAVFFHAEIDKDSEGSYIIDLSAEFLPEMEIINLTDGVIKDLLLFLLARIKSRFLKLDYNICKCRQAYFFCDVFVKFYVMELGSVPG